MKIEVYRRKDGKWAWRVRALNNKIVAVDGAQGYEHKGDAMQMAEEITSGGPMTMEVLDD